MKVKELIEKLQEFDPELEVLDHKGELSGNEKYGTYELDILNDEDVVLIDEEFAEKWYNGKSFVMIW